jgi:hypothetical protein
MHALREFQGPREKPIRIPDIKQDVRGDEGSSLIFPTPSHAMPVPPRNIV